MNIIVVGAGIAGLSTAWSLVKAGHSVTILEQGPIPNPLAASGDHHRIIRRAYRAASGYGPLITEAYAAWDEMWADLGENHLDPRGFLCISREPGDEAEEYREGLEDGNFPFELLEPDAAVARWPFLEPDSFRYAYFSTDGGALHCRKIATGLAGWLRGNGANVYEHAKVAAIDCAAGSVTLSNGDTLRGGQNRRHRRRLGPQPVSGTWLRPQDLPHRARLCRAARRSEGGLGSRAGHPRRRRQDRRLHDPADRRRRHEVRFRPAQGAKPTTPTGTASLSRARARRSATCSRRRSRGFRSTASPRSSPAPTPSPRTRSSLPSRRAAA